MENQETTLVASSKAETWFAKTISAIFQPLLMPFFSIFILFNSNTYISYAVPVSVKNFIYLVMITNMVAIPILIFIYFVKKGIISSLSMEKQEDRRLPFLVTSVFYLATFYLLRQVVLPNVVYLMILGAVATIFLGYLITPKWKISMHMMSAGSVVGAFVSLSWRLGSEMVGLVMILLLVSGLIGYARLRLDAHTPMQIYAGFVTGWVVMGMMVYYF